MEAWRRRPLGCRWQWASDSETISGEGSLLTTDSPSDLPEGLTGTKGQQVPSLTLGEPAVGWIGRQKVPVRGRKVHPRWQGDERGGRGLDNTGRCPGGRLGWP